MFHIRPLPLSVELFAQESATSLASRLARRNGAPRLITFCSDIGINYFALCNGDVDEVCRLAAFASVDENPLLKHTPCVIRKDWFQLGEAEIKFSAFQRTKPRICPICNADNFVGDHKISAHQNGSAQLIAMRVCPLHLCVLQELPKAQSNKDHFDIAQLATGYDSQETTRVQKSELKLIDYILSRLNGTTASGWYNQLPFHVATQTAENFGLLLLKGPIVKRQSISGLEWLQAGSVGYSFLQQGPDAMIEKLGELERNRPMDNSLYRARFGVFFEWLRNRDDDVAFDAIRDPVRDFIFDTYPISKGAQVLGVENPRRKFHTHRTLTKERRLDFTKTGHALIQRGYARKNEHNSFELLRYVPAEVADKVAHELNRVFTKTRTAKKLGVTRATLDQLIAHKLILPHFKHRGAVPGFHSDEIWQFATSVTKGWVPYFGNAPAKRWVSFQDAAKLCRCATWQVIAMVIHYKLPVTNPDRNKKLLSDHITCPITLADKFTEIENGVVSLLMAGRLLGCERTEIERLIVDGSLKETPIFARQAKKKHRSVEREDVEALMMGTEHL